MRNLQNAQETVSKIMIHIINHIIRKFLKEKGNNFLICRSIKTCKAKNVVLRYKIMSKCVEGDSYLQKLTGIRRHRLRALFKGRGRQGTLRSRLAEKIFAVKTRAGRGKSRSVRGRALSVWSGKCESICNAGGTADDVIISVPE